MAVRVGIVPAAAFHARPRLLWALARALPVRFEPRAPGAERDLDAVIRFGAAAGEASVPCLSALGEEAAATGQPPAAVSLAADAGLDPRLAGATVSDGPAAAARSLRPPAGAVVAATRAGAALWLRMGRHQQLAAAPAELAFGEALRHRMSPGRCLALLAVVHFLREVCADRLWVAPPLRAAFIIDDPNLHWTSYGHVRFAQLARDAARHGYHVAMATVPLDGWFAHPGAARVFRDQPRALSLLVHGHLHDGPELGRITDAATAMRDAQDALRRVAALERRTGLPVGRVMVPPHERLSEPAAAGLRAAGFAAVAMSRPHPWLAGDWLAGAAREGPLVGWELTDRIAGGMPVLLRHALSHPRDDLVLRAFLDQPLLLYGHQEDLAGGPDALREAAAQINAIGDVRWEAPAELARASVQTRREGQRLLVRTHTRVCRVEVPPGVREVHVTDTGGGAPRVLEVDGPGPLTLGPDPADAVAAVTRRARPRPVLRRLASEGRDRIAPLLTADTRTPERPRAG